MKKIGLIFLSIILLQFYSCNKDTYTTDSSAKLTFSKDTILFDTVFTTFITANKIFMVYNKNSKPIKISSIRLAGGTASFYKVNVNGKNNTSFNDVEIFPNDSMYIFVAAKVDQIGQDKPLLIRDSLIFITNGNEQKIRLISYGQDVTILKNTHLKTQTLTSNKPYMVFGTITVDTNQILTIQAGTRIYMYNDANLIVYGSLKIMGETNNRVLIHQTRLEDEYYNKPGQWGRIALMDCSKGNIIDNTDIWSPVTGIEIGEPDKNSKPDLLIRNSMIVNAKNVLLKAYGASIVAENCVFANANESCVEMYKGGKYKFYHCTINKSAVRGVSNVSRYSGFYYNDKYDSYSGTLDSIFVVNSILYGGDPSMDIVSSNQNFYFKNCILNTDWNKFKIADTQHFDSIIYELKSNKLLVRSFIEDSVVDKYKYDFSPDSLSDARGKASFAFALKYPVDLKGNSRLSSPDIGALQWEPIKK